MVNGTTMDKFHNVVSCVIWKYIKQSIMNLFIKFWNISNEYNNLPLFGINMAVGLKVKKELQIEANQNFKSNAKYKYLVVYLL